MRKFKVRFFIICLMLFISQFKVLNISALSYSVYSNDSLDNFSNLILVSDNVMFDSVNDIYYLFDTSEDIQFRFINLDGFSSPMSICLPGDPGYPNCQSNPVVRIEYEYISHYVTDYLVNPTLMLGNYGWVFGGVYGATMAYSSAKELGFTVEGISVSRSVGSSQSFPVPPGVSGNIKYKAKWRVETQRIWNILQDGQRLQGPLVKIIKFEIGGYFGVYIY